MQRATVFALRQFRIERFRPRAGRPVEHCDKRVQLPIFFSDGRQRLVDEPGAGQCSGFQMPGRLKNRHLACGEASKIIAESVSGGNDAASFRKASSSPSNGTARRSMSDSGIPSPYASARVFQFFINVILASVRI